MSTATFGPETIQGTIKTVFFSGPRFSAGRFEARDGRLVPFAGKFYAREGELVVLEGAWSEHPKYGRQFDVRSIRYDLDFDVDGLASYLANHPSLKGIGRVKARLIADRFGKDLARWLEEQPETVAAAAKVPLDTIHALRDEWRRTKTLNAAMLHLSAFELSHGQVTRLVEKFGPSVVKLLEDDPYLLVREIKGLGFRRVDKLARALGTPKDLPGRIRAGLRFIVEEALGEGDCWIDAEDLVDRANKLLVLDAQDSRERIEGVLDQLLDEGGLSCASRDGRFLVSDPEIREQEEDLAEVLRRGAGPNPHFEGGDVASLEAEVLAACPSLNEDQKRAVVTSLGAGISVITGGAGVGKSFLVSSIVSLCEKRDLSVVLAAPTGKAAKRLEQVTGKSASTIHRLLGFDGKGFALGPDEPIDADVLVIDEGSMIDSSLAWRLFRAVDLDRTAVILVGDHNQLPPVGPGNILRDLIETRAVPTTILGTVVRQAGVLKENAIAVLDGQVRKTSELEPSGRRAWYVADQFGDQNAAQAFLLELFERVLAERLRFDLVRDVQVLTPTHKGPLGTAALNVALQRLVQWKLWGVEAPIPATGRRPRFLLHDKVIQRRNDYETGVMNGAIGRVTSADRGGSLTIDFDGTVVELEAGSDKLRNVELAYALTIHSTQGSEFPCAVVIVHKAHSFMHHRNLLYTAVTRAKETAILVGDRWGMRNCAEKRNGTERRTFLSFLLAEGRATELPSSRGAEAR